MDRVVYLIIAIVILIFLLVIFFVSFIIYRRMPAPKGCEDLKISDEHCSMCGHSECSFYKGKDKEEE
ncbi:MAG: hypothetical protein K6F07_00945 [Bacilli bacterium]|nr:hypothetical protein [Bacilli bacterium]